MNFSTVPAKNSLPSASACAGSGACAAQVYSETLFLGPPVGDLIAYQAHHHDHLWKSYDLICLLMLCWFLALRTVLYTGRVGLLGMHPVDHLSVDQGHQKKVHIESYPLIVVPV